MDVNKLFQGAWDLTAETTSIFGHPDSRSLIVIRRHPGHPNEHLEVTPKPLITTISPRMASAYQAIRSIQLESTDFRVIGISASYTREQLVGRGIHYLIDGELVDGEPVGGKEADLVAGTQIERESHMSWSLVLRYKPTPSLNKF